MTLKDQEIKSRLRSLVWDCIQRNRWRDDDDFSLHFTDTLFDASVSGQSAVEHLHKRISSLKTNFFALNSVSRNDFLNAIDTEVLPYLPTLFAEASARSVSPRDLFPGLDKVSVGVVQPGEKLDVPERQIQDLLRSIFRQRGASSIPFRGRDSSLEVADIEHFRVRVHERFASFAVVVKGYRSIPGKKLRWEDVAHQVTKAFRTKPDHILLVSAKEPVDGFVTQVQEYAVSVGNPDLVVFLAPIDLYRLIMAHSKD